MTEIKSARRALSILEALSDFQRPVRVSELQGALGIPQSSMSKLLRCLADIGYLHYSPEDRTYFPTLRVSLLGSWLQDKSFGRGSLLARMEAFRDRWETSVLLGVQNDMHVLYILALPALRAPRPPLGSGALRPLCRAAVGKALLMLKTDQEIGLIVRRINAEQPDPRSRINLTELLADVGHSRERGFARSNGEVVPNTGVIAMPLAEIAGQPSIAIGAGASLDWLNEHGEPLSEALAAEVRAMALD
ncbi:helix-turn-helix domain-containing protein [Sphingobium sp. V4]|uniref:IclR family transcriptional regulator n=1 Tax=Sphingobium sp. V4 TaxID=3038927 RepID=UPI0025581128|nr:helix-turn-helix domain-containing protein [Sphingobium sp. V4]WIW89489.1 helix-turn-helix domain-containing protein [Sphingobium sp. V4]